MKKTLTFSLSITLSRKPFAQAGGHVLDGAVYWARDAIRSVPERLKISGMSRGRVAIELRRRQRA